MTAKLAPTSKLRTLICAGVLIAASTTLGADNLLKNPGFEEVGGDGIPSAWQREFNPVLTGPFKVVDDASEGKKAVQLMTEEWVLDRPQFIVQDVKLPAGAKAVRLAAWCKGQGFVRLAIQFRKGGNPIKTETIKEYFGEYVVPEETDKVFGLHGEYMEYEHDAVVPEGADSVRVRIGNTIGQLNLGGVWGTAWIDNATLTVADAVKPAVTKPTHTVTKGEPKAAGLVNIAPYAKILTDPPCFNPKRLVDDMIVDTVQFTVAFELIQGSERCPSFTFSFPDAVPAGRVDLQLLGNADEIVIRGDPTGNGRFDEILARLQGMKGNAGWASVELPGKPVRAIRVDGIAGDMRGYHSSISFLSKVKILAKEDAVKPQLGALQQKAVYRLREYPKANVPVAMPERIAFVLPAGPGKHFERILTTDMWMFGINLKKDAKAVDYRATGQINEVVQACRLCGFDSILIFMENWSSPVVPWPSKVCNSTDENILKPLVDALHAERLKVYVMPSSATCPPFPGLSIFVYPKEETSRYPQTKQFPSLVHGTHYRDNWLAMMEEVLACGADGVALSPDENYYKGHFMETFPKDDPGRELYRKRFGHELPAKEEDTLAFRQWITMRHEGICDLYGYWSAKLRAKWPKCYLGSRFMQPSAGASYINDMGIPMDMLGTRGGLDHVSSDYLGPYGIYGMAAANGWRRGAMCYDSSIWGPLQGAPRKSDIMIMGEALWSVMYGLGAIDIYRENYLYEQGTMPGFARAFTLLDDLEKLGVYDARPPKKVAFLSSRTSMDWWQVKAWWGRHEDNPAWDRGVEAVRGWYDDHLLFNIIQQSGVPFDWCFLDRDDQLKNLEDYKLLIIPFAHSISKNAADKIKAATAKGAKVILFDGRTGPTDEWGEPYPAPVLQELVDSGKAILFKEDLMREGSTDGFVDNVKKAVFDSLGAETPFRLNAYGKQMDATMLQKENGEYFVFLVNWEKACMNAADLSLNLPAGKYEIVARSFDFWYRLSLGGNPTPTHEQLREFRLFMVPETAYVLYIRPAK